MPVPTTAPATAADDDPRATGLARRGRRRRARPSDSSARPTRQEIGEPLRLDPAAVANVEGLEEEVALLRAAIRRLADDGDVAGHVKTLVELRLQIAALCTALKTQRALSGGEADAISAALARVLEELGNEVGVPQ